jgi:GNAT superfamily N-acetyltransferase
MTLELEDIDGSDLRDLPAWASQPNGRDAGCRYCLYWEQPTEFESPVLNLSQREAAKAQWFREVSAEFGCAGKLVRVDGAVVGYAQFAPAQYLPMANTYECGPPSDDAVLLSCLFIVPDRRGQGFGRALLQALLKELRDRGIASVETFTRKSAGSNPSGPVEFWLKHGFQPIREDADFALVHMELS